jgi:ABC-type ATPase with predicted acetyltransferase domain
VERIVKEEEMATFKCAKCGHEKEARCKPEKCPKCEGKKCFEKKQG